MKLLPCPFCGGEAEIERYGTPRQSCIVACQWCGGRHESGDEGERSGWSWNQRAEESAISVLKEVMEWISNWSPNFEQDDEWPATAARARAILEKSNEQKANKE